MLEFLLFKTREFSSRHAISFLLVTPTDISSAPGLLCCAVEMDAVWFKVVLLKYATPSRKKTSGSGHLQMFLNLYILYISALMEPFHMYKLDMLWWFGGAKAVFNCELIKSQMVLLFSMKDISIHHFQIWISNLYHTLQLKEDGVLSGWCSHMAFSLNDRTLNYINYGWHSELCLSDVIYESVRAVKSITETDMDQRGWTGNTLCSSTCSSVHVVSISGKAS